jgi:hypothetical protein
MLLIRFLVLILVVVAVAVVAAIVNTWWIAVIAIVVLVAMTVATVLLVLHYTGAPDWLGPDANAQLESGGSSRRRPGYRRAGGGTTGRPARMPQRSPAAASWPCQMAGADLTVRTGCCW